MNSISTFDPDISITLPLRIDFAAIETFLKKKFIDTNISKTDDKGHITNYAKILDLQLAESHAEPYNLVTNLQSLTLTRIFYKDEIGVIVQAQLNFDVPTQTLSVESYKMDTKGEHWMANTILKSVLNTFIYKKIIDSLSIDITPIIKEKIESVNAKLASKLEATQGISILGEVKDFSITHFEIKNNEIWVLVNTTGWCVIAIEELESGEDG